MTLFRYPFNTSRLFTISRMHVFFLLLCGAIVGALNPSPTSPVTSKPPVNGVKAIVPTASGQIGINPPELYLGNATQYIGLIKGTDASYITVTDTTTKVSTYPSLFLFSRPIICQGSKTTTADWSEHRVPTKSHHQSHFNQNSSLHGDNWNCRRESSQKHPFVGPTLKSPPEICGVRVSNVLLPTLNLLGLIAKLLTYNRAGLKACNALKSKQRRSDGTIPRDIADEGPFTPREYLTTY